MSTKLRPNDFSFGKTDRRILLEKLEKFYVTEQRNYLSHEAYLAGVKKTKKALHDRRFRLRIKPIEMLLYMLGSDFMSNVKPPSIRRTFEIAARDNRVFQSRETITRHMRKAKSKRAS
ncbi:hypothetical protein [Mucilaginibacter ginkgonis]|uniref:Uncharacterized protein n=1 Tax=Mucilaginibacter ginkgonis TaxID=2682091 RepID=A0A6I4IN35_9SPHI|nr:hypothetical protein [Mucilaginibacter ginkgonis]QQL51085.1 hypothetical protein GO620_006445 [Mucilaginibacter ginkgonis]